MLEDLKKLLEKYPDALQEKKRFKALLYDYFPMKRKEANAIYMALEIGIPDNMLELSMIKSSDIIRYERQLKYNYGIDDELIIQVIELWAKALNITVDYDFLNGEKNIEQLDEEIYRKFKNEDNVYQMFTMAIKEKFQFVRDNYYGTSKMFDDIIVDIFQYDKGKAVEIWLWLLKLYWDRLSKGEDASETLLFSVLIKIPDSRDNSFILKIENAQFFQNGIKEYVDKMLASEDSF